MPVQRLRFLCLAITVALSGLAAMPAAHAQTRSSDIRFQSGTSQATVTGRVSGRQIDAYRIGARRGQEIDLNLTSRNTALRFSIEAPDGRGRAMTLDGGRASSVSRYTGVLPATGTYVVRVFLDRDAARRNETARYSLTVGIDSARPPSPPPPQGGTVTYMRVTGLRAGDTLNVRQGPSTANPVLFTLDQGDVVASLGCRSFGSGSAWCEVYRPDRPRSVGWASSRYLAPAARPDRPGGPDPDRPVSGTLDCRFVIGIINQTCRYSARRIARGVHEITVQLPGRTRTIRMEGTRAVSSNGNGPVFSVLRGDVVDVSIGALELYRVPLSALGGR
ncbi:hypothetical protein ATO6_09655 [Oceanicola sp. 22II-s10i]|uniref:SH3 domain-containing protein n=1 Tax=Oceanicola sp. 22II-s10i TaxID=1317116 RepID=UPI000B52099C|nr:SH3 domain-containing protein [Oceanicola sp. 22II-s10i]OWU85272.1 hypothetical protein ATO6_09655 [Oceanicola sp. 22II-s10i]